MKRVKAFTLLELLIVIIILGILAALALPQYLRTVERGRSSEAIIHLGSIRISEINYYAEHRIYSDSFDELDLDDPNDLPTPPVGTRLFDYSITSGGNTFTASAVRIQGGEVLTINENGRITRTTIAPGP